MTEAITQFLLNASAALLGASIPFALFLWALRRNRKAYEQLHEQTRKYQRGTIHLKGDHPDATADEIADQVRRNQWPLA